MRCDKFTIIVFAVVYSICAIIYTFKHRKDTNVITIYIYKNS